MDENEIKKEVQKWIEDNKDNLPINIEYWDIDIYKIATELNENGNNVEPPNLVELLYKPHSRTVKL